MTNTNNSRSKNPGWAVVVAGLIVVGLVVGIAWFFYNAYCVLTSDSDASKTIIGGIVAVLVAIISGALVKYFEYRNAVRVELRAKKAPIYEDFIRYMLKTLVLEAKAGRMDEKKAVEFFADFTPRLALWGTDEVFRAYLEFRSSSINKAEPNIMFLFEKIIWAMRRDLGHKNKGLGKGDVLRMFVNDLPT